MFWRSTRLILFVVAGWMVLAVPTRAGVLAGLPAIYGPGTPHGTPTGQTVQPNNDNVGLGNPNRVSLVGIDIEGLEPIDIHVSVANSPGAGGTTEYFIELGNATNKTEVAWNGFSIQLGSGIGSEFARLSDRAIPGVSGLDFDTPHRDPVVISPSFPTITHEADVLSFSGGLVRMGEVASGQNFSIDVPNIATSTTYDFTIRLEAVPVVALPGDFDGDGDVDGRDLMTWQRNRSVGALGEWQENYPGRPPSPGDFDGDGDVDGRDFLAWQRNPSVGNLADWRTHYGPGTSLASQGTVVPEPAAVVWLAPIMVCGASARGARRG